jgi:predicted nucleotidyltransferase
VAKRSITAKDAAGIDLSPLRGLLTRIAAAWQPEQIWLFGSRARGSEGPDSDWDLLVVVPDTIEEEVVEPVAAWRLARQSGVPADIVPCRAADFREDRTTPNTLAYEAASRGILLYER